MHIDRRRAHELLDEAIDAANADDENTAFRKWSEISAALSEPIVKYLVQDAYEASGELPEKLPLDKAPTPPQTRIYTGQIIARVLYELRPTIGKAFHPDETALSAAINDLIDPHQNPNEPPRVLPTKVGSGKTFRSEKRAAGARIYELVIHEQHRLGHKKWEDAADQIFGPGALSTSAWGKSIRKSWSETVGVENKASHKDDIISRAKSDSAQPHPDLDHSNLMHLLQIATVK